MSPQPQEAARQVLARDPRAGARVWLWPLVVAVSIAFALDTYLVATAPLLPFDLARVWARDHWPSDVAGGFLLALGWSALVVWPPERWLPSPTMTWISLRGRRSASRGRRAA